MGWVRLDNSFWRHPKVQRLQEEYTPPIARAAGFAWALLLSRAGDTGSTFSEATAKRVGFLDRKVARHAIDALVEVGLWVRNEDGTLTIHGWAREAPSEDINLDRLGAALGGS